MLVEVCMVSDLAENTSTSIETEAGSILVCKSGGEIFAIENKCTHQDTPLAGGRIRRGHVSCPLHGVLFNLSSGEPIGQLTRKAVRTYPVVINNDQVAVDIG